MSTNSDCNRLLAIKANSIIFQPTIQAIAGLSAMINADSRSRSTDPRSEIVRSQPNADRQTKNMRANFARTN
jgi:hypothetical protein